LPAAARDKAKKAITDTCAVILPALLADLRTRKLPGRALIEDYIIGVETGHGSTGVCGVF
jgi:hypothetical protein